MRILLVEDTADVAEAIVVRFARDGHAIDHAPTAEDASALLAVGAYDLVILDINLPDGCGFDILKSLRAARRRIPVLVLTARLAVEDRVGALDIGADDYLTKPFDLRELEARARALVRRSQLEVSSVVRVGALQFDPAANIVTGAAGEIALTRRELRLLEVLVANRKRVISKDEIHGKLFNVDAEAGQNAVELYVARLRRKIAGCGVAIRTHRGLGYQLTADD